MARSFRDLAETPLPEVPCWVEPRLVLKGGLVLLGGPAAIGKTFLVLDLADSLSRGEPVFGTFQTPAPARVLLIEQEVGEYGMQERLIDKYRGRPAPEGAFVITKSPEIVVDDPIGFENLERAVNEVKPDVLILDPATRFMVLGDESDNTSVARFIRQLDRLLVAHPKLAVIMTHHFGKDPKGENASGWDDLEMDNIRGASKWRDAPDLRITVRLRATQGGRPAVWDTRWVPRHSPRFDKRLGMAPDFSVFPL